MHPYFDMAMEVPHKGPNALVFALSLALHEISFSSSKRLEKMREKYSKHWNFEDYESYKCARDMDGLSFVRRACKFMRNYLVDQCKKYELKHDEEQLLDFKEEPKIPLGLFVMNQEMQIIESSNNFN